MKKILLFCLRYIVAFFIPTVVLIVRYKLYKSVTALYVIGIVSLMIVGIAVCKWIAKSENTSIPRKYAYIVPTLQFPVILLCCYLCIEAAVNYTDLLKDIIGTYFIFTVGSIPITVWYNSIAWENYRREFGGSTK